MGVHKKEKYKIVHRIDKTPNSRYNNVALSTVNRWELNKAKPNMKAMKKLKEFCDEYGIDYEIIEKEWLIF